MGSEGAASTSASLGSSPSCARFVRLPADDADPEVHSFLRLRRRCVNDLGVVLESRYHRGYHLTLMTGSVVTCGDRSLAECQKRREPANPGDSWRRSGSFRTE